MICLFSPCSFRVIYFTVASNLENLTQAVLTNVTENVPLYTIYGELSGPELNTLAAGNWTLIRKNVHYIVITSGPYSDLMVARDSSASKGGDNSSMAIYISVPIVLIVIMLLVILLVVRRRK